MEKSRFLGVLRSNTSIVSRDDRVYTLYTRTIHMANNPQERMNPDAEDPFGSLSNPT